MDSNPLDKQQHWHTIKRAAKKGSSTAQQIMDIWQYLDEAEVAFNNDDRETVIAALAKAIRINPSIVKLSKEYRPIIEERMSLYPDDIDAITCYLQINSKNEKIFLNFVPECLAKFPNNEYLLEMRVISLISMKLFEEALQLVDHALDMHPTSLRFMYWRAMTLVMDETLQDCTQAFDAFLTHAPEDHEKVPACHYRKATYYYATRDMPKFIKAFHAGQEAEQKLLPCFLPYTFPYKRMMKGLFEVENSKTINHV